MHILSSFDHFAGKWMPLIVIVCLACGITFSGPLGQLSPFVPFVFALMTFTGALRSSFREIFNVTRRPAALIVSLLIVHIVIPLLALGVGKLFFSATPDFITGIVLEYVVPSAVVSIMWSTMTGGDVSLTLGILLVDTLTSPFTLPLSLRVLVGSTARIDSLGIMREMIWMVAVPALLTMILNQLTHDRAGQKLAPVMAPFGKICLIFIITVNSTCVTPFVLHIKPSEVGVAAVILSLAVFGYCAGWTAALLLRKNTQTVISMTFACGMRNISAGVVVAATCFPAAVVFPVIIGTLFQQALASLFSRLLSARYKTAV